MVAVELLKSGMRHDWCNSIHSNPHAVRVLHVTAPTTPQSGFKDCMADAAFTGESMTATG